MSICRYILRYSPGQNKRSNRLNLQFVSTRRLLFSSFFLNSVHYPFLRRTLPFNATDYSRQWISISEQLLLHFFSSSGTNVVVKFHYWLIYCSPHVCNIETFSEYFTTPASLNRPRSVPLHQVRHVQRVRHQELDRPGIDLSNLHFGRILFGQILSLKFLTSFH